VYNKNGSDGSSTTVYEIRDSNSKTLAKHVRADKPDGTKDVRWYQPDDTPGLNGTKLNDLPLYGSEDLADVPMDEPVIVVEGEKARRALEAAGIPALGTVTGASGKPSSEAMRVLEGRSAILWPDNDDQGRDHMNNIGETLQGFAAGVALYAWEDAPDKGDAADHPAVQSGDRKAVGKLQTDLYSAPKWQPSRSPTTKQPKTASELMAMDLPEIRWAVPGIIPEGVSILAGKPKLGKSWLALGLCVSVASGGYALGKKPVEKGEALYLGLEDNTRRLQKRMGMVIGEENIPEGLYWDTEFPRMDDGGLVALDEWLGDHPGCRIVVVDTLAKFKPRPRGGRNAYDEDRETVDPLGDLIEKHSVAIVLVHHMRKMAASDPIDEINASTGLSAGVDGVLLLKRERGEADASLYVDGREIEETSDLALKWDGNLTKWILAGEAEDYRQSDERRQIVETLRASENPMGPKNIAEATGGSYGSLRVILPEMAREGKIANPSKGKYTAINNINTINNNNTVNDVHSEQEFAVNDSPEPPLTAECGKSPIGKPNTESVNDVNSVNGANYSDDDYMDVAF
jgi:5S rRNA maturation endonuclease (ribonuclease M5)